MDDHRSQFTSWAFSERIKTAGLALSMGRIGDAYVNGMMEAFWARMQTELLNRRRWRTPPGTRQRDLRVPRGLPQPKAPPLKPRNARTHRI
jgi:transposase InsO family protein